MSRHTIPPKADHHTVVVGWDRPMGTFFAHVRDLTRDEDDQIIVWLGGDYTDITESGTLLERVERYAVIPAGLQAVLDAEAREDFIAGPYTNVDRDWIGLEPAHSAQCLETGSCPVCPACLGDVLPPAEPTEP